MRSRSPSPATVLSAVALFFALGGSAIAAHHYLITSTSQIKPNVLKKLKGNAGQNGAPGPAGAQGAQGAPGPAGPSNLSALSIVKGESKSIPMETVGSSTATCPAGSHAVSGGGYTGLANLAASEMSSDHQSWFLIVDNETVISTHLEAVVHCAGAGQAVAASAPRVAAAHERVVQQADRLAVRLATEVQARKR
jgi:hypothetical protein